MSVEGLWCFQSTSYDNPNDFRDGGVVVLETNRIFGGDSMMAYVGEYELAGDLVHAKVQTWQWNLTYTDAENVFGMRAPIPTYTVLAELRRDGEQLVGTIAPEADPAAKLAIRMLFIQALP